MPAIALLVAVLFLAILPLASAADGQTNIHMLVPGFTVRELPVRLPNINNLRFAPDGRLTALGYDGRVWLLRDTNGDGLEDRAETFWDQPTLRVPVGMAWTTSGLVVSSQGKVSLLRDTDADGKADAEEIIASGWPKTDVGSGGVDATAVTLDQEGNIYFGLLVADYSNPYRLRKRKDLKPEEKLWLEARGDKGGTADEEVSLYDTNSLRGTIQKWNAKAKKLETIATGIRVPYTLAFNKAGDLFLTDQEGETWCPNGNPLDELNHIIPGRNYGFPPRHEKWLPNLVSEPPVVGFGPQHQSSCGLVFNEPHGRFNSKPGTQSSKPPLPSSPAQGLFGPGWWEGDAIVTGESRGKLWRVRLTKTPNGYVGKEHLIARLDMLTTDVAISPKGDLYVSCHSGPPDWGTGPKGDGKLFKISYTDPKAPQPVAAWAAGPMEVRVAFDKAVDSAITNRAKEMKIEFGEYARAGDRYEVLKPPYKVVKSQEAASRSRLNVVSARLDAGGQVLVLATDPHALAAEYALTIPGVKAERGRVEEKTVDVEYDLSGAAADVYELESRLKNPGGGTVGPKLPAGGRLGQKLGLVESSVSGDGARFSPTLDSTVSAALVRGSKPLGQGHEMLFGHDTYRVGFRGFFRVLAEKMTIHAISKVQLNFIPAETENVATRLLEVNGLWDLQLDFHGAGSLRAFHMTTRQGADQITLAYSTPDDPVLRPLPLPAVLLPWVSRAALPAPATNSSHEASLAGGDWGRGKVLFFNQQLKCATCHRVRGEGGLTGPDLSNLVSRDSASVLRDIKEPSAAINPDYTAHNITLQNGDELSGIVRAQDGGSLKLATADGKESVLQRTVVKELRASSVSLMPSGLLDALKESQVRDLLTFLLYEPPQRTKAEVNAALRAAQLEAPNPKPESISIVLVASKQDHGPGEHDYPAWQKKWNPLLASAPGVIVSNAWEWPTAEQFRSANVIVFYYWNHDWSAERYAQLDGYLARGGGVVVLHSATIADKEPEQLAERLGLAAQPQRTKYLHCPLDLAITVPANHPITQGLPRFIPLIDEPYWPMIGDAGKVDVLAATEQEGKARPMIWTFQKGKGRVFASILGHYSWTHDDPLFRILVLRGVAWAARADVRRLEKLSVQGVDFRP